jgi:hypothetical protein
MRFNPFVENLKSVLFGGEFVGDSCCIFQFEVPYSFRRQGSIVTLPDLDTRDRMQVFRALANCHWVRLNDLDAAHLHSRKRQQVHMDGEIDLSNDAKVILLQQEIDRQDTACDRILDGHYGVVGVTTPYAFT